jgi:5-methyltetrahydrofolate--homocysteine methyltransferase
MITIAEKINASIPSVKKIIESRDSENLLKLARSQADAGADYIDVNVGTGSGTQEDEMEAMAWAVSTIQNEIECPLCIDSADPKVLEAGLKVRAERPCLINSTKASEKYLAAVIPLAKGYDKPLVGLAMDEEGIPKSVEKRVEACLKIAGACSRAGIRVSDLYFDPLVLPVSTDVKQGKVTLDTIAAIKKAIPESKTVMAVSNVSYGLPNRKIFNTAFLHMAIMAGLDAAILSVLDRDLIGAAKTAEAVMGRDRHCRKYSRFWRKR